MTSLELTGLAFATVLSGFMALGLAYGMYRERATGQRYLLFWPSPLSESARRFTRNMFLQGTAAELSRVLFFAIVFLFCLMAFSQAML